MQEDNLCNLRHIDHEVRMRIMEEIAKDIRDTMRHIDNRMESRFNLLIGLILTAMIFPIIFHALKWI